VLCVCVQVIGHLQHGYRDLLCHVRSQYEQMISMLEHEYNEQIYVSGKLMAVINAPATLRNYSQRADNLSSKSVYIHHVMSSSVST